MRFEVVFLWIPNLERALRSRLFKEAKLKMTNEVSKQEWKQFFDQMSLERINWNARVEVIKEDIGAQVLANNLPLAGITFEEKTGGNGAIEIMLGGEPGEAHQTHTIMNPTKVVLLDDETTGGGTLEIEDAEGGKTLVEISQPAACGMIYTEVTSVVTQV